MLNSGKTMKEIDNITINYEKKFGFEYNGRVRTPTTYSKSKKY
jgi:hypothetical protein